MPVLRSPPREILGERGVIKQRPQGGHYNGNNGSQDAEAHEEHEHKVDHTQDSVDKSMNQQLTPSLGQFKRPTL